MILLTDIDGYDILVDDTPGNLAYVAWDPDKDCSYLQFYNTDLYVKVQETPLQIHEAMAYGEVGLELGPRDGDEEMVQVSGVPYLVPASSITPIQDRLNVDFKEKS